MKEFGGELNWFMVCWTIGALVVAGLAVWVLVWQHRKRKRERRALSRQSRARLQAWRDGKSTPSQQAYLDHKNSTQHP